MEEKPADTSTSTMPPAHRIVAGMSAIVAAGGLALVPVVASDDASPRIAVRADGSPSTAVPSGDPTTTTSLVGEPTTTTSSASPPSSTSTSTTTIATTAAEPSCGSRAPGGTPSRAPDGIDVTVELSSPRARIGDPVTIEVKARNTSDRPVTYTRSGAAHSAWVLDHDGKMVWHSAYGTAHTTGVWDETFAPGEVKTESMTWTAGTVCDGNSGFTARALAPGRYTVDGSWDSTPGGAWPAAEATLDIS